MLIYKDLTDRIIGGIIEVHKALGAGLLEAPYHNALYYELVRRGLAVEYNAPFEVMYRGQVVGEYFADLVVDRKVIIEVKSVQALSPVMKAQVINYLKISGLRLGLLVNFHGLKAHFERVVV